jgi:excisionase family DNA binding protein
MMSKDKVARYLGVSVGAVERYTARGRLTVSDGSTGGRPAYDEAEVRRLKEEMDARAPAVRGRKRTLSLEEAAAATGLPREELLGRAIDGRLRARWCGSAVRLRRTEVEALTRDLE